MAIRSILLIAESIAAIVVVFSLNAPVVVADAGRILLRKAAQIEPLPGNGTS